MTKPSRPSAPRAPFQNTETSEGTPAVTRENKAKRVFIVGCRRSGTTWTMLLLAHHPNVVALQQIDFFRRLAHFGRWFDTREAYGMRALTKELGPKHEAEDESRGLHRIPLSNVVSSERYFEKVRPVAEDVYDRFAECNPDALAVVEQTPEYVQVWREILAVFPDAYFLHIVRDPRSVFCSHRNAARSWADPTRFSYDPIEVAGEWAQDVSRAREIAEKTPNYLELRYEDLRAEPNAGLTKIYDWLELPSSEGLVEEAVSACSIDKMRKSSHAPKGFFRKGEIAGWRQELKPSDLRLLEFVAGDLMRDCGYQPENESTQMPWRLRMRLSRQEARQNLARWAYESNSPLKRGASSVLKSLPGVRRLLLRNLKRSA